MRSAAYKDIVTDFATFYKTVSEDLDTIIVNKEGSDGVVMMSVNEYNSLLETIYLMSSRETMADIRQAEADLKEGKGIEVNISDL